MLIYQILSWFMIIFGHYLFYTAVHSHVYSTRHRQPGFVLKYVSYMSDICLYLLISPMYFAEIFTHSLKTIMLNIKSDHKSVL